MCDIGKPLEIIDVQPLNLPAPLRREEQPEPQPIVIPVEVPVGHAVEDCTFHQPILPTE